MAEQLHELWADCAEEMRIREEKLIRDALIAEDWYIRGAARRLGVQGSTLLSVLATRHPELNRTREKRPEGRPARAA